MRNFSYFALFLLFITPASVQAQTTTSDFNVQIPISAACHINSTTDMNFPTSGVIAAAIDATSTIAVHCTSGTPYNLGLSAGTGTGATVAERLMTGPASATIEYSLYQDTARLVVWGNTTGSNTQAGTGNGSE